MRIRQRLVLVAVVVGLVTGVSQATIVYKGKLASDYASGNSTGADGLLLGDGVWVTDPGKAGWVPAQIEWEVSQAGLNSPWVYYYKVTVYKGALSHLIVEVSESFTDVYPVLYDVGSTPSFSSRSVNTYYEGGSGEPGMPDDVYGIKFDSFSDPSGDEDVKVAEVWFSSERGPVWGDFYAKDGAHGTAWNAGFVVDDPLSAAANGSVLNHLLVPDTFTTHQIPEPTTMTFVGLCAAGLLMKLRRKHS